VVCGDCQEEDFADEVVCTTCTLAVELLCSLIVRVDLGFILDVNAGRPPQVVNFDAVNLREGSIHERLTQTVENDGDIDHESVRRDNLRIHLYRSSLVVLVHCHRKPIQHFLARLLVLDESIRNVQ
jgi:hypothetical protein